MFQGSVLIFYTLLIPRFSPQPAEISKLFIHLPLDTPWWGAEMSVNIFYTCNFTKNILSSIQFKYPFNNK